jgi:glycosyltransferase involved in cell wall biosynthesis
VRFNAEDITVIVPVKDGSIFLERVFKSIRDVSNDIEIVFIENGSTDKSLQECVRLADDRTQVFQLSESGVSRARNFGISAAQGKIITLLDADDEILADRIKFIENHDWSSIDFVIGCMQLVDSEESSYPPEIKIAKVSGLPLFAGSALIFTKTGFAQIGGFNENLSHGEDMDLILRAKKNGMNSIYTPTPFLIRHFHENNASLNRSASASGLFSALRSNVKS